MYEVERLKEKLAAGQLLVGSNSLLADPAVSELLAMAGSDYVWIDMEHAAIDYKDVEHHIIGAHAGGAAAIVRVPWNDAVMAKKVLDMGPDGILFPLVRSAEEVRAAVEACSYPPAGIRGWNPLRAAKYGAVDGRWYRDHAQDLFLRFVMLEHIDAYRDLDAILAVPGLDGIMIGPSDLSGSMGKLLETNAPDVQTVLDDIVLRCNRAGMPVGVALGCGVGPDVYRQWLGRGIQMISIGQDVNLLVQAMQINLAQLRQAQQALS